MHSYGCEINKNEKVLSYVTYGDKNYIAAIKKKNFIGLQFHPENSGNAGLKLIKNFINEK